MKTDELKKVLETIYPNHNFHWQQKGNQLFGFCPEHNDTRKQNLVLADKGNGAFFKCFACGFSGNGESLLNQGNIDYEIRFFTQFANLCVDTLINNKCLNAKIANTYLEFRNPDYKSLIKNNVLVGTIDNDFNVGKLAELITTEEPKEKQKIIDKFKNLMNVKNKTVPLLFFYTNKNGYIEQIKIRYIFSTDEFDGKVSDIDFSQERNNKQFSILKTEKQTINAFGLHLFSNMPKLTIFVTEGEFNTISFLAKKYDKNPNEITLKNYRSISIGSAQNLEKNLNLLNHLKNTNYSIIFALDNDEAGIKALMEFVTKHTEFLEDFIYLEENTKDIDDCLAQNDFPDADFIYKNSRIFSIKEMLPILKFRLEQKEQEQTQHILDKAVKEGFNLIIQALGKNIDNDSIPVNLANYPNKPNREWLINGLIAKNKINIFAGLGGSGKTTLTLQWILHLLLGIQYCDIPVQQIRKAMIISAEEDREEIAGKINSLLNDYFAELTGKKFDFLQELLKDRISIITNHTTFTEQEFSKVITTKDFEITKSYVSVFNPDLILIDSLSSTNRVEIQKSHLIQAVLDEIRKLTGERSVIYLAHMAKDTVNAENIFGVNADKILGSASLTNKVRQVLLIFKNQMKVAKSNLLPINDIEKYYYELEQATNNNGEPIIWGRNIRKVQALPEETEVVDRPKTVQKTTQINKSNNPNNQPKKPSYQSKKINKEIQGFDTDI